MTKIDESAIDSIFTGAYSTKTKTISTYTTDFAKAATYSMKVKVCYSEAGLTAVCSDQSFTIVVTNPCSTDTLAIGATEFASPALTYNAKSAASVFGWVDAAATSVSSFTSAQCGTFTWTVTKIDGS